MSGFWDILTSQRELRTARTSGLARWWTVVSATTSALSERSASAKAAVLGEEPQNWLQPKGLFFQVFSGFFRVFSGFFRVSPYSLDFKVTSFTRGHLDGFIMFHQSIISQSSVLWGPDSSVYKSLMMRSLIDRDPIGVRFLLCSCEEGLDGFGEWKQLMGWFRLRNLSRP